MVRRGFFGFGRFFGRYFVFILLDLGLGFNLKDSVKGYIGEEIKDCFMDNIWMMECIKFFLLYIWIVEIEIRELKIVEVK